MSADRFTFRLGRLLSLRERKERDAGAAYSAARARVESLRSAREEVLERRDAARARLLPPPGVRAMPGDAQAMQLLIDQAEARMRWLDQVVQEAETEAETRRAELGLRLRERRVLERLRERQKDTWREDSDRRARDTMDAVALRVATAGTPTGSA